MATDPHSPSQTSRGKGRRDRVNARHRAVTIRLPRLNESSAA